ncbi:hypothetical protein J7E24_11580 [Hymenobacter sp. ISL-91]|uniref:hypothetical protein n=1 Tax=Hymenobacter sp. ISL-91 TaxID=2819151 RepID=UPI001BEAC053|nr:hypothetical protein [Hymenobacter sp. ISL-91]MBT2558428.1 hypothetical protein [Hymenobacter sp. ISL-91]
MTGLFLQPDIIVYSASQEPRLLVEVKVRQPVTNSTDSEHWPSEIRQQFGRFDCYFLLVTPERMALFLPGDPSGGSTMVWADSSSVLREQLDTEKFPLQQLDRQQLVSVVYSWLMFSQFTPTEELLADPAQQWLVNSGLHEVIFHGDIQQAA